MIKLNNGVPKGIIAGLVFMTVVFLIATVEVFYFFPAEVAGPLYIGPVLGFTLVFLVLVFVLYLNSKDKVLVKKGILLKNVCCDIDDYEKVNGKQIAVSLPPNNTVYTFNIDAYKINMLGSSLHVDILFDPKNPKHFIAQDEIEVIGELAPGRMYDFTPVISPEMEAQINNQQ